MKLKKSLILFFSILSLFLISANSFSQNQGQTYRPRSVFYAGIYAGLGFSTLHEEKIEYQYYNGSYINRKTIASPYLSYSIGIFADVYIDTLKTFGFGLDVNFTRAGYKDRIYNEFFRTYYIIIAPKIISWTKKDFYIAGGWYFAFLVDTAENASDKRFESWDHGVFVDWGFIQDSKNVLTKTGFKIYIGLKNVFTKWDENLNRIGEPEGFNFMVHFYVSFIFGLI